MMLCHTSKFPLHFIGCVNESKIHRKGLSSRLAISSHNTIGVLGGVSAHSTVDFLEKLVKWSSECKPGNLPFIACNDPVLNKELSSCERSSSPYLSSRNTPYQFNESLIIENLRSKRLFLEQSGSRCIVMPCHVSHVWYNEVSRGCSVPFFHIGECVARELKEANLKPVEAGSNLRIGVIATEAILKSGFYQEQLKNLENPNLKEYINKPLKWFDELAIIVGDDHATGSFSRNAWDDIPSEEAERPINLDEDVDIQIGVTQVESQDEASRSKGKKPSSSHAPRPKKAHRNKEKEDETKNIMAVVKEVSVAIQKASIGWSAQLADKVHEVGGKYSDEFIDMAVEHLYENRKQGKLFIIKTRHGREKWMADFAEKNRVIASGATEELNSDDE